MANQIKKIILIIVLVLSMSVVGLKQSSGVLHAFTDDYNGAITDLNIFYRSGEYTINDSGRFKQKYDKITTSNYTYTPLEMKMNYSFISVLIKIDIREVDDGYQYIFLYNGESETSTLLAERQIEHTPGKLNTTYETYSISFDNIPLNLFSSNDLVIRYGASGSGDDDWKNKNLKVSVIYQNNNVFLSLNVKYSEHISPGETKIYYYYSTDQIYYVVETRGDIDTHLTVIDSNGNEFTDDDSGVGENACVGFYGGEGQFTIKLRGSTDIDTGTTELQIRKQQAVLYGFDYGSGNINTTEDLTVPYNLLREHYNAQKYSYNDEHNSTHIRAIDSRGYSRLNSEIVFFTGHGNKSSISFPDNSKLRSNFIKNMENTKLVVWSSCFSSVGTDGFPSMTQAAVDAGAKTAIGWPTTITDKSARKFTNLMFTYLYSGYTVADACNKAKNGFIYPDEIMNYTINGDKYTTISYEIPQKNLNNNHYISLDSFNKRYLSSDDWKAFEINNTTRIYRTINNCITDDFYILEKHDGKIINIEHSGIFADEMKVLSILKPRSDINVSINNTNDSLFNEKSSIVYSTINDELVPIEIKYCTYVNTSGAYYETVICTNLYNGSIINYEDICIRK